MLRFGLDAKAVAGAVREGVKQVYYVADGAEGPRGWKVASNQPRHIATIVTHFLLPSLRQMLLLSNSKSAHAKPQSHESVE